MRLLALLSSLSLVLASSTTTPPTSSINALATVASISTTQTQCPLRKCTACPSGRYGQDANGCQNCDCLPAVCPQVRCAGPCPSGLYRKDSNGCQTCACLQPATSTATTLAPITSTPTSGGVCPDGSQQVQCFVDPCQTATCSAFPNAVCRSNYCGGCNSNFYNEVGGVVDCSGSGSDSTGSGSGVVVPVPPQLPVCGMVCMIYCENGNVLDSNGCPSCKCNPAPASSIVTTPSTALVTTPAPKDEPVCGAVCMIYCPNGNVKDGRGCPTCRCNPSPTLPSTSTTLAPVTTPTPTHQPVCGPVCMIYCPNGNVKDARGCPTCRCNPSPTSSSSSANPTAHPPIIAIPLGTLPPPASPATVTATARPPVIPYPIGTLSSSIPTVRPLATTSSTTTSSTTATSASSTSLSAAITSAVSARFGPGAKVSFGTPILSDARVGTPISGLPAGATNLGPSSLIPGGFISGIKYGN